jgi:hypothetical protein
VQPLAVVEDLDELEEVEACFAAGRNQMLPRIQVISRFSVDQNVSMAALSQQSPVEPNDTWSPACVAIEQKSPDT